MAYPTDVYVAQATKAAHDAEKDLRSRWARGVCAGEYGQWPGGLPLIPIQGACGNDGKAVDSPQPPTVRWLLAFVLVVVGALCAAAVVGALLVGLAQR